MDVCRKLEVFSTSKNWKIDEVFFKNELFRSSKRQRNKLGGGKKTRSCFATFSSRISWWINFLAFRYLGRMQLIVIICIYSFCNRSGLRDYVFIHVFLLLVSGFIYIKQIPFLKLLSGFNFQVKFDDVDYAAFQAHLFIVCYLYQFFLPRDTF